MRATVVQVQPTISLELTTTEACNLTCILQEWVKVNKASMFNSLESFALSVAHELRNPR